MALSEEQIRRMLVAAVGAFRANTLDEIDSLQEAANNGDVGEIYNRLAFIGRQAGAAIAWLQANGV